MIDLREEKVNSYYFDFYLFINYIFEELNKSKLIKKKEYNKKKKKKKKKKNE